MGIKKSGIHALSKTRHTDTDGAGGGHDVEQDAMIIMQIGAVAPVLGIVGDTVQMDGIDRPVGQMQ